MGTLTDTGLPQGQEPRNIGETSVTATVPDKDKLEQASAARRREQETKKGGKRPESLEEMLAKRRAGLTESDEVIKARLLAQDVEKSKKE